MLEESMLDPLRLFRLQLRQPGFINRPRSLHLSMPVLAQGGLQELLIL
jgi:hypothetical protein